MIDELFAARQPGGLVSQHPDLPGGIGVALPRQGLLFLVVGVVEDGLVNIENDAPASRSEISRQGRGGGLRAAVSLEVGDLLFGGVAKPVDAGGERAGRRSWRG